MKIERISIEHYKRHCYTDNNLISNKTQELQHRLNIQYDMMCVCVCRKKFDMFTFFRASFDLSGNVKYSNGKSGASFLRQYY